MTKLTRQELISACNATFGNISNFLVRECGFQLPTNAKSGHETRLVCPHHKSKKNDEEVIAVPTTIWHCLDVILVSQLAIVLVVLM